MEKEKPRLFRVIVLGECGIGKTNFCMMYLADQFADQADPTIEDSYRKEIEFDDKQHFMLEILDTAGGEAWSSLKDAWIQQIDSIIIGYDITNISTFQYTDWLIKKVESIRDVAKIPKILLGTKIDLEVRCHFEQVVV